MLAIPGDILFALILFALVVAPIAVGSFVAKSKMIDSGRDRWYRQHLSDAYLSALENNLDDPLLDDDEPLTPDAIIDPRNERSSWWKAS